MKKMLSLMLAFVLVLGVGITAMAGENTPETYQVTYPVKAPDVTPGEKTYTYEIYQIFTGDYLREDGKDILGNIRWGQNGTGKEGDLVEQMSEGQAILKELEDATGETDIEKLKVIMKYWNQEIPAFKTIKSGDTENLPAGYYLIKDKDGSLEDQNGVEQDAYTVYIVQVVGSVKIERKSRKPDVDKEVEDNKGAFEETADHAIGESFQFKLTATLPPDIDLTAYDTYELVFHDTMSDGVTFERIDSVTYKIGNAVAVAVPTGKYSSSTPAANGKGGILTITINDLTDVVGKNWGTDAITVEVLYSAHLNENAVISSTNETGAPVNNNKVLLEYSNNPYGDGTGRTEEDTVFVFTYESDYTKVSGSGKRLEGVTFKLYQDEEKTKEVGLIYDNEKKAYRPVIGSETPVEEMSSAEDGKFNIIGLDAGTYYLDEVAPLPGYNKLAEPIKITIEAKHKENVQGTGADLTLTIPKTEGKDSLEIVNNGGVTMPDTGGMGTTIFYVVGGILVLGCGVILIARKRVKK